MEDLGQFLARRLARLVRGPPAGNAGAMEVRNLVCTRCPRADFVNRILIAAFSSSGVRY